MAEWARSTPCVGICSTTYGDLVCRGCKRFAHEIVAWNGYSDDQRDRVWQRLHGLRDQATAVYVTVVNAGLLRESGATAQIERSSDMTQLALAYELLRRRARDLATLEQIGLRSVRARPAQPLEVRDAIDAEFHLRSVAYFERSFHTPVDS